MAILNPRVLTSLDAGIATLTLNDATTDNALGEEMVPELMRAIGEAVADSSVRVILLAGGADVFSCGAPRELLVKLAAGTLRPTDILLPKALLDCPLPIVAAMAGHAIGGGFALGLSADIILMARESRYGFTFMNLGFSPGMGTTQLCEHVLSPAVAHELLYTGELRKGADFASAAGINHVLPKLDVPGKALDIARRIAEKPRLALEALKRTLSLPRRRAFEETITLESLMHQITFRAVDAQRRIEADYVE